MQSRAYQLQAVAKSRAEAAVHLDGEGDGIKNVRVDVGPLEVSVGDRPRPVLGDKVAGAVPEPGLCLLVLEAVLAVERALQNIIKTLSEWGAHMAQCSSIRLTSVNQALWLLGADQAVPLTSASPSGYAD